MKKLSNSNGNFEYELLDQKQPVVDLRDQLAGLYSSPFADILWWELRDLSLINNGYYKLFYYEQSVLKHIILFKYSAELPGKIIVLTHTFKISSENIENISCILFYEFDKLQQIIFENIFEPKPKKLPKMVFERGLNDIVIFLPDTLDTYMKSLGMSTRKKIRLIQNRIAKDFPDFKVHYNENGDILFKQIERLISLNKDRMIVTGKKSFLTDTDCKLLYQYASTSGFGLLCLCTIDDKIIGGTINYVIGEHAYMHVISHDNSYNKYSIGQIALFNATKYLIEEKNIKYYHLMSGSQDYKFRHGGIYHDRYIFWVFRNNGVHYFWRKTMSSFKENGRKYKARLRTNKIINSFFIKLEKIKMKIQGV